MTDSVRFDRAADHYDRSRAISDEAMERTIALLASELRDRGRVLEVGVGTGLLALPLHEVGIPLAGLDLTAAMVAKLVEKAGRRPFPLVLGDATRIPFADDGFGGAYLRWVLHLIPGWRDALGEMVRVVVPGGVVLVSLGAYDRVRFEVQQRFSELTGIATDPVGLMWADYETLDAEMTRHGATLRVLPPLHEEIEVALGGFLDEIEEDRFSWTWSVPEDVRRNAARELRPWARERFGPLDRVERHEIDMVWRAYDLPGGGRTESHGR